MGGLVCETRAGVPWQRPQCGWAAAIGRSLLPGLKEFKVLKASMRFDLDLRTARLGGQIDRFASRLAEQGLADASLIRDDAFLRRTVPGAENVCCSLAPVAASVNVTVVPMATFDASTSSKFEPRASESSRSMSACGATARAADPSRS